MRRLETVSVLKALAKASRALAALKGFANTIANKHIQINAVTINEAREDFIRQLLSNLVLYLVLKELIDSPILYLSRFIIQNKLDYYRLLQTVRETGEWEAWIIYILKGVEKTAEETLQLIKRIHEAIDQMTTEIRMALPKIYSKELRNLLFGKQILYDINSIPQTFSKCPWQGVHINSGIRHSSARLRFCPEQQHFPLQLQPDQKGRQA